MKKYSFKGHSFGVSAEVIGNHIQELMDKKGGEITPEDVLKSAKSKKSKIHDCFEWDDTKAAHAHRVTQARYILRKVTVIIKNDEEEIETRAFVNIKRDESGELTQNAFDFSKSSYVSITAAMESDPLKAYTLDRALIELDNFAKRYKSLKELSKVFEAVKKVKAKKK